MAKLRKINKVTKDTVHLLLDNNCVLIFDNDESFIAAMKEFKHLGISFSDGTPTTSSIVLITYRQYMIDIRKSVNCKARSTGLGVTIFENSIYFAPFDKGDNIVKIIYEREK